MGLRFGWTFALSCALACGSKNNDSGKGGAGGGNAGGSGGTSMAGSGGMSGASAMGGTTGGGTWTQQTMTFADPGDYIATIWGAGPNAVYACSRLGNCYRSNGAGQWSDPEPIIPGGICYDMWGTATNNIYLAITTGIRHGTN